VRGYTGDLLAGKLTGSPWLFQAAKARGGKLPGAPMGQPKQLATAINEIWSMDFVADALFDGRKLRMLTVVDLFTREWLAIDVGQSLKGVSEVWWRHARLWNNECPCW
jgi:hypothetical protein